MAIWKNLLKMITYQENNDREGFALKETEDDRHTALANAPGPADKPDVVFSEGETGPEYGSKSPVGLAQKTLKKPRKVKDVANNTDKNIARPDKVADQAEPLADDLAVSALLAENKRAIERLYGLPDNKDIVLRPVVIGTNPGIDSFIVFIDGLVDKSVQDLLIQALMFFTARFELPEKGSLATFVKERLLPGNQVFVHGKFRDVLDAVNYGDTALFLEGCDQVVLVETKGWEHRGVERSAIEQAVRGPQDSFVENLRVNTALIRKLVKDENLTTEIFQIGSRNRTNVAVMYLRDLANPSLVAEVKRRVAGIRTDLLLDSGMLEEFIQDHPYNLLPTVMSTERPDKAASGVMEGRVAIVVDGSPFVLIVPCTMFEMLHTGEEHYSRWQFGTFIRYLRVVAFGLAFLLPGLYLAVVLFHQEMIPTELLLAIAGSRERVPFPSIVEVLIMELSFELIREAGLRVPGFMGSTIGIVGALILGQAAVQANIVSPILVIIVAVTGLASFAIPYYSLAFALRIYRFIYIILGASLGFLGIAIGLFAQIILTANMKSFGVPYLSPIGPKTFTGTDVLTRLPIFFQERLPDYLNPQESKRQPNVSREWLKGKGGAEDQ